jgi:hypothetical protein
MNRMDRTEGTGGTEGIEETEENKTTIHIRIDGLIRDYCSNFLSYLYPKRGWKRTVFDIGKENYINQNDKNTRILITNVGTIMITCSSMANLLETVEFLVNEFEYGRMKNYLIWDQNVSIKTNYITTILLSDYCYEENTFVNSCAKPYFSQLCLIEKSRALHKNLQKRNGEKEDFVFNYGTCSIYKNLITLKYESYDNGYLLISKIRDVFFLPEVPLVNSQFSLIEKEKDTLQKCGEDRNTQIQIEIEDEFRPSRFEKAEEKLGNVLKSEVFIFSALILWFTAKILEGV